MVFEKNKRGLGMASRIIEKLKFCVNINWLFLIIFTFYQFTVIFDHFEIIGYMVYYVIPVLVICINYKYCIKILHIFFKKENRKIVVCTFLFFLISAVWPIILKTYDFSALKNEPFDLIKAMIIQLFLIIVYFKYFKGDINLEEYVHYYVLACAIYVIGTILMLVFPDLKMFFYEYVKEGPHAKQVALQSDYITRYGWSGFSNFEHTMKCSIAVGFLGYFVTKKKYSKKIVYYFLFLLCLLGNMFYGRIGIVASSFILLIVLFYLVKEDKRHAIYLSIGIVAFAICIGIIYLLNDNVKVWLNWIFINFINMFNGGDLLSGSLGVVVNDMIFVPSTKTIFWGDGLYTTLSGGYYMNTDVGFMRTILFGGIPYTLVRYGLFYYIIRIINKKIEKPRVFSLIMTSVLIIGEIKGEILITFLAILVPMAILLMSTELDEI